MSFYSPLAESQTGANVFIATSRSFFKIMVQTKNNEVGDNSNFGVDKKM
jgi:hypothetical protein